MSNNNIEKEKTEVIELTKAIEAVESRVKQCEWNLEYRPYGYGYKGIRYYIRNRIDIRDYKKELIELKKKRSSIVDSLNSKGVMVTIC